MVCGLTDEYEELNSLNSSSSFHWFFDQWTGRKYLPKSVVGIIGSGTVLASFIASIMVFLGWMNYPDSKSQRMQEIIGDPVVKYFDFINIPSLKIPFAFQIDQLSSVFLLIITGVGFLDSCVFHCLYA